MFNPNNIERENDSFDKKIKSDFLKFSSKPKKDSFIESLAENNQFIKDDLKIRSMVIDSLEKEFGKNIKNIKGYDFLVDSVINKLKNNQLELEPLIQE